MNHRPRFTVAAAWLSLVCGTCPSDAQVRLSEEDFDRLRDEKVIVRELDGEDIPVYLAVGLLQANLDRMCTSRRR